MSKETLQPWWQKNYGQSKKECSFTSMYEGWADSLHLLRELPAKEHTARADAGSASSAIPFTALLDDLMPELVEDRASQVKRWNALTDELWSIAAAESHFFAHQEQVKTARLQWRLGLEREAREEQHRRRLAQLELAHEEERLAQSESFRELLESLYSGERQFTKWTVHYNDTLGTAHPSPIKAHRKFTVSAEEAARARDRVPLVLKTAKALGSAAGGRAALNHPKAKAQRKPGKKL